MFYPGSDSLQDSSGVGGIPTRFVWPHGGTRVYVTGSFRRWTDHVVMSPVEGAPNVFQAICPVPPGFHQYKFFVDGEWRHDELQPCVSSNYGIVNTLVITRDPAPPILSTGTPGSRTNMDVDDEVFRRAVTVSGVPSQEAPMNSPEPNMDISRHRISLFLSAHTAYELLPESGKVIAFDVNLPVKQAFHILYEQGVPVAPLWDSFRGQFVGMLSPLDFILILREIGSNGSNLTQEELETHTISAWKEGKRVLYGQVDEHGRPVEKSLVYVGPFDSLKDVALKLLQNNVATVPIIHSASQDGLFPQLLHVASLSGILSCICRHFRHSSSVLPILKQPICMIPLGTWVPRIGEMNGKPLAMLRPSASLGAALALLVQARVSSVPIVDDNDSLVDTYSRSDITALAKDRVYTQIRLDEMTIHKALQLRQDANVPYFDNQRCQMCLRSDPLLKVLERLAIPGVRRIFIVEAGSKRVEGIISLSDVFRFLLS